MCTEMEEARSSLGNFSNPIEIPFFVATKLGRGGDPGWPGNFTPEAMIRHTDASLSRLGVERLDLIQLHCIPQEVLEEGAVFDVLRDLKKNRGRLPTLGQVLSLSKRVLSASSRKVLLRFRLSSIFFRQKLITDLFGKAKERDVSIIARVPLASGLLSGKMKKKNTTFDESDHRNFNRDGAAFNVGETFAGVPFEKGVELAEELKAMKPEGMTLAQMALRWILDFDAVSVVIPGASRPSQVVDNAAISDLPPSLR